MPSTRFPDSDGGTSVRIVFLATLLVAAVSFIPDSALRAGVGGYLALHTAFETMAIVVGCLIWVLVRESRQYRSVDSVILGSAFFAAALLDFGHLLSYPGMPDFVTPSGTQKAIGFWLAARLVLALALVKYALRGATRRAAVPSVHCGLLLAGSLSLVAVVFWGLLYRSEAIRQPSSRVSV